MSSLKLSAVVITTVFVFVALMSMQSIAASSVEGAAHTNENHRKLTKSRFLVSNSMEGGSRRKLINACPWIPCMGKQTCCPDLLIPGFSVCVDLVSIQNCGACNNKCLIGEDCCSEKCVNTQTDVKNCGLCGHACINSPCTLGFCNYGR